MDARIDEALLQQFSAVLAARVGLHFPPPRWPEMLRGMRAAASEFGFADVADCLRTLVASAPDRRQIEVLARHLSVGETYFFRDPALFALLEQEILPALVARRATERRLRLWSAGCATGEEPYSLAMALMRLIPDLDEWNITIRATDINPVFLARAESGAYREWSFRGVPAALRRRHFHAADDGERIDRACRRLVSFDYLNLVDDVYPSLATNTNAMDLVLCRNVLMYFDAPTIAAVVARLARAVVDGGWFVAGAAEVSAAQLPDFEPVHRAGAILYRKCAAHRAAAGTNARREPPRAPADAHRLRTAPSRALASAHRARTAPARTQRSARPPDERLADERLAHARELYARGDYAGAKTLVVDAHDARSLALQARCCANLGELDAARAHCEAAIAAERSDAGLRYLLASVLDEAGCADAALVALRQALYLDPGHVLAHFALANLLRRRGEPARAAKHFAAARRLLAAHPADAPLPESDGLTAARLGEIIDATGSPA